MVRRNEEITHIPVLDDTAGIEHDHLVADLRDEPEAVRDEQDRTFDRAAQRLELGHDLRLDGNVEGGGRLVGDEQAWLAKQRHGDHDALPYAPGKLVGILTELLGGVGDADPAEHGAGALFQLRGAEARMLAPLGIDELRADAEDRVQRRHRVLEDHGDAVAAQPLEGSPVTKVVTHAIEDHAAGDAGRVGRQKAHQRRGYGRFPAPRLADHADDAVRRNAERNFVERAQRLAADAKAYRQIVNIQHGGNRHVTPCSLGSVASRRASPKSVEPSVASVSAPAAPIVGQTD